MLKHILLAGALAASATATSAATSFNLTISSNSNVPLFTLTNTSTTAEVLTFSISIGLETRNFDYIDNVSNPTGGLSNVTLGASGNGGSRFDVLALSFKEFVPGESISFIADIDEDSGTQNVVRDYRDTLFNNGTGPNSELTATFSDGASIVFEMPDQTPSLASYSFSVSAAPIPLPAGLPLLAAGLGAFAVLRKRKG